MDDIEEIRCLKARYFRFLDTKDWPRWRGIFSDDARFAGVPTLEALPGAIETVSDGDIRRELTRVRQRVENRETFAAALEFARRECVRVVQHREGSCRANRYRPPRPER